MKKTQFYVPFLLLFAWVSQAQEMEHLGAPPRGVVFVDVESISTIAPLQFLGTADPPTVLFNGNPLPLSPYPHPPEEFRGNTNAVWLNSEPQALSGTEGRFFVQLTGDSAAISIAEVVMRNKSGKILRAQVTLNRTSFEGHLRSRLVLDEKEGSQQNFQFHFTGFIPPSTTLKTEAGVVVQKVPGIIDLQVSLPVGKTVIAAKLEQKDGSIRLINIPFVVTRVEFDLRQHVLSIYPPRNNTLQTTWDIRRDGDILEGVTQPGSKLWINDEPMEIKNDGSFTTELAPVAKEWESRFRLISPAGEEKIITKKMRCPEFEEPVKRFRPFHFRVFQFTALQGGGSSFSGGASWNPEYRLPKWGNIRGNLALLHLKGATTEYFGVQYEILFAPFRFKKPDFEIGGGAQTWFSGGTAMNISLVAGWRLNRPWFVYLERFFASYSALFISSNFTHEFKIGVELGI